MSCPLVDTGMLFHVPPSIMSLKVIVKRWLQRQTLGYPHHEAQLTRLWRYDHTSRKIWQLQNLWPSSSLNGAPFMDPSVSAGHTDSVGRPPSHCAHVTC